MSKKIAIVTGATGGFGREFLKLISKEKDIEEIWAISRSRTKLDKLTEDFKFPMKTFAVDLSDRVKLMKFQEILEEENPEIKYLVNNAGYAKFCSYNDISIEESLNMMDVNMSAVVAVGLMCIPFMPKGSHIINVASQASFLPLPYLNIYGATKAFVRHYSRALNTELKEVGISVTAVCPGWMKTGLFERGNVGAKKGAQNFVFMTNPDVVAKKAFRDAKNNKDFSAYGAYVNFTLFLSKVLPHKAQQFIWLSQQKLK